MRKWSIILSALILLLCCATGQAEETAAPAREWRGVVSYGEFPQGSNLEGEYPDSPEQIINAVVIGDEETDSLWLRIPDGMRAEDFHGKGVYFTTSRPVEAYSFALDLEDMGRQTFDDYRVRVLDTIEIAGETAYGVVRELTDDLLRMEVWFATMDDVGDEIRVTLTPDTGRYGNIIEDDTCDVVYDPDTMTALWLLEAHG